MQTGRTLPDLAAELARQAESKRDFVVLVHDLAVTGSGDASLYLNGAVNSAFTLGDIAHGQLAEYLAIPKPFYDRLRADQETLVPVGDSRRPLYEVMVNALLEGRTNEQRLIRTLDGRARAFLSDTFNPDLDNYDVFRVAARAITEAGLEADNVISAEVTERKLYLKVVSPRLQAVVQPENVMLGHGLLKEPQVVQAGFVLSNSEIGLGSLKVQQMVYKLMCTNMWIKEETYRARHLGRALESGEDGVVYRSDTRLADAQARLLKIRDHIEQALSDTSFRQMVGLMQESAGIRLQGGLEVTAEATARRLGLSAAEKERMLQNLVEGADLSLWGLSNAVTATAHTAPSYDRATELQALGGRLLSLPAAELREILRPA